MMLKMKKLASLQALFYMVPETGIEPVRPFQADGF
jgi:hypothetical protein